MEVQTTSSTLSVGGSAWQLVFGFVAPMVTKAVCELGVPDILAKSKAPLTASEIVERIQNVFTRREVATNHLGRIMHYLGAHGVFIVTMPSSPDDQRRYSPSPISMLLQVEDASTSTPTIRSLLMYYMCPPVLASLHHFSDLVTRDVPPMEAANGMDLWELCRSNKEVGHFFNKAMASASYIDMEALLRHYRGFDGFNGTFVDVAGGVGSNASRIVGSYPSITRAINYDLPHVISTAPKYPRVEHISGDMFESVPPGDIIMLKWILHCFNDEECIKILKNCHKALPKTGKIIIVEVVMDTSCDIVNFPNEALAIDIMMMALTTGKERTEHDWATILRAAGFPRYNIIGLPCAQSIIEAYPK